MIVGFLGTGGITEAIVRGMFNAASHASPVLVSRRNRERSDRLVAEFALVESVAGNQDLVDRSDWVVVAVLPAQAPDALSALRFREDQVVVSLPAGIPVRALRRYVDPARRICRALPMPPVEFGLGATPIHPADPAVQAFFDRLGGAMPVADERQFNAMAASSAVMATFFAWVASNARWLEDQGVPRAAAARYATSVFHALASMAVRADAAELQRMSEACLTPGGLNEQVLTAARRAGVWEAVQREIGRVMDRLQDADGSR